MSKQDAMAIAMQARELAAQAALFTQLDGMLITATLHALRRDGALTDTAVAMVLVNCRAEFTNALPPGNHAQQDVLMARLQWYAGALGIRLPDLPRDG
jgi:hypothetical protein